MRSTDVLIVGGSMGGRTVAVAARSHYRDAKVTMIRPQGKEQVMVPCGLPYIFGTLGAVEKNITPDEMMLKRDIELIVDEAKDIDRGSKTVTTAKGDLIGYKKLILATGSAPLILPLPGRDLGNVFSAIKDMSYLRGLLNTLEKVKDVVIIGGGFIGLEFGDEFRKRGLNVTIVEILPHCLQLVFDDDFCTIAENKFREGGGNIRTNARAEAILGDGGKVKGVRLASGEEIKADMVFFGVGVRPNTELAQKAGLKIGENKAIWVDIYQRTSDENIFAIGDCAEKISFFTRKPSALRLSSIAAREGRIAGANLFELKRKNKGAIGSFATMVGNLGLGMAGLTEGQAKKEGFDVITGEFKTRDKHPGTMPEASELGLRLVFDKANGNILGGQLSGGVTTADIINVIAALIEAQMKIDEVATYQYGVHPLLTSAPSSHPIPNAAEDALSKF
jgi:NADH oxidase (H2O2-forming)